MDEEKLLEVKEDEQPKDVDSLIQTMRLLLGDRVEGKGGLPSLDEARREELKQRSGWLGRLALLAPDSDDQAGREALIKPLLIIPIVMGIVLGTMGIFGLAGLVGIVVFIILALKGKVRHGFQASGRRGGLYAETFALWVLFFFGCQYLVKLAVEADMLTSKSGTTLSLVAFFLSLIILGWPVVRGVSFQQVRQDIGWTTGRGVFRELFGGGFAGYAMALPILGVGVGLTLLLLMIQEYLLPDAPSPSHPIQDMAASNNLLIIVQMYILGSIAAPIVEETFFRGVLYRHFREFSRKWSLLLSVFASALASSLIFAGLHPQGLAVIPSLASLGIAFCLIREWRGSLLAPMFVHGFSNFLIISLNFALFGAG
ncbi:MAG: CPBP family intramembrane metalloprotease [Planctomycetes bacterium]|nr:CPBP family intramembrane metalloprotease [Planctomycetota bacterium]